MSAGSCLIGKYAYSEGSGKYRLVNQNAVRNIYSRSLSFSHYLP